MQDPAADSADAPPPAVVDARGHRCPTPTLRLRRALEGARPGERVLLLADDPLARIDIPHFVAEASAVLVEIDAEGPALRFLVEKR